MTLVVEREIAVARLSVCREVEHEQKSDSASEDESGVTEVEAAFVVRMRASSATTACRQARRSLPRASRARNWPASRASTPIRDPAPANVPMQMATAHGRSTPLSPSGQRERDTDDTVRATTQIE